MAKGSIVHVLTILCCALALGCRNVNKGRLGGNVRDRSPQERPQVNAWEQAVMFRSVGRLRLPPPVSFRFTIVETVPAYEPPVQRSFICEFLIGDRVLLSWRAHEHEAFELRDNLLVRVVYDSGTDLSMQEATVVAQHLFDDALGWTSQLQVPITQEFMSLQSSRLDVEVGRDTVRVWESDARSWRISVLDGRVISGPSVAR